MSDDTDNPYLRRLAGRSKGHHGNKSEKRVSKLFEGAKSVPGSGALLGAKGDTRLPKFLVESKATINASYSLKKETLDKIAKEASDINLFPALTVSFTDPEGKSKPQGDWVLMPLYAFKELTEE